jgi:ABC-type branched-subunit amino acid transport system ATPase component
MLALARALVGAPKLLLLDEPSAGIQPSIVQEIEARIGALNRDHRLTILLVEQNIEFAAALSQRVYVMDKGRIARQIRPEDVMNEEIVRGYLAV